VANIIRFFTSTKVFLKKCIVFLLNLQIKAMNLVIDIGNTSVKAAVFKHDTLIEVVAFDKRKILSEVKKILKKHAISSGIMSSVASISENKVQKLQDLCSFLLLDVSTKLPFVNLYQTPKTLGVDRIGLVVGAVKIYPKKNVLVIDAGTCITFDFMTEKGAYLGGAISPGINMRYKALNSFTAKLPLLEKSQPQKLIGQNTKESIHSGIVNGVLKEIDGVILSYKEKYMDLTVVLTGGDTKFLAIQLKSSIFANQNFLLQGLNNILIFNKDK
jgi:type III pantothenate kinase